MKRMVCLLLTILVMGSYFHIKPVQASERTERELSEMMEEQLVYLTLENSVNGKLFDADLSASYRMYLDYYTLPTGDAIPPDEYKNRALYISRNNIPADGIINDSENAVSYRVDTGKNVVMRKRYNKFEGMEQYADALSGLAKPYIDIENGFYSKLYLLAAARGTEDVPVEIVYTDGSREQHSLHMENYLNQGLVQYWTYYVSGAAGTPGALSFKTYTIETNQNKIADRIEFGELKSWYISQVVLALSGKRATSDGALAMLQADINAVAGKTENQLCIADLAKLENIRRNLDFLKASQIDVSGIKKLEEFEATEKIYLDKIKNKSEFKIYVDANGKNGNGTINTPFGRIEEARDAIRTARANGLKSDAFPISVIFKEGVYRISDTVNFAAEDSGTEECEISYRAAENANVVFTGAAPVDGSKFKPVTDANMLSRLPKKSRGEILCLDLASQGINEIPEYIANDNRDSNADVMLFANGREQPVAQYPNGDENYARSYQIVSEGSFSSVSGPIAHSGGSFVIEDEKAELWKNIGTDSYVVGNFAYLWNYNRILVDHVDSQSKTLSLYSGANYKLMDVAGGLRYKVKHILEELDAPGEWYIDRENIMLYYYPVEKTDGLKLELAVHDKDIIRMDSCSHMRFNGISFERIRGRAIYSAAGAQNISIDGCNFSGVGSEAVRFDAERTGVLGGKVVNGGYDVSVTNNNFSYIGDKAVRITGSGYLDTLTPGNNVIANNYIYKASLKTHSCAVEIDGGIGCTAKNNVIHNLPMYGIVFRGTDHVIKNNEIYNAGREGSDVGAIYTCYGVLMPGTEIAYNYLHDILPVDGSLSYLHKGVYLDGSASGNNIHHNIIYRTTDGIFANGRDNKTNGNVIVDTEICSFFGSAGDKLADFDTVSKPQLEALMSSEFKDIWLKNYPGIDGILENPVAAGNQMQSNVYDGVIHLTEEYQASLGTDGSKDNARINFKSAAESGVFVNPSAQDFRIKKTSGVYSGSPNVISEDYDMNNIGLQGTQRNRFENALSDFAPIYPKNNQQIESDEDMVFFWEDAKGADAYEIIIATDEKLQNVVYRKTVDTNWADLRDFEAQGTDFYWNIKAINKGRQPGGEHYSSGAPYQFTLSKVTFVKNPYETIDISDYCNVKLLIRKGEKDTKLIGDDYWNKRGLNQELLERQLNDDKELYVENVKYAFMQLEREKKAINPKYSVGEDIAIALTVQKYQAFHFLANYGSREVCPLEVEVQYTDGEKETLAVEKVYSAYQRDVPMAPRLTLSWVLAESGEIYPSMYCQLNSYTVYPTRDCAVESLIFKAMGKETTNLNSLAIFALTAEPKHEILEENGKRYVPVRVRNRTAEEIPYMTISKVQDQTGKISEIRVANGIVPALAADERLYIDIPQESTEGQARWFLWDKNLSPITRTQMFQ